MAHGETLLQYVERLEKRVEWLKPMARSILVDNVAWYANIDLGGNIGFKAGMTKNSYDELLVRIWRWWPAKDVVEHQAKPHWIPIDRATELLPELRKATWNKGDWPHKQGHDPQSQGENHEA